MEFLQHIERFTDAHRRFAPARLNMRGSQCGRDTPGIECGFFVVFAHKNTPQVGVDGGPPTAHATYATESDSPGSLRSLDL